MSDDILDHPTIQALLHEADAAQQLVEALGSGNDNFRRALEQVYCDLGRALHELLPKPSDFDEQPTDFAVDPSHPLYARVQEMKSGITEEDVGHVGDEEPTAPQVDHGFEQDPSEWDDEPTRVDWPGAPLPYEEQPTTNAAVPKRKASAKKEPVQTASSDARQSPSEADEEVTLARMRVITSTGALDMQDDAPVQPPRSEHRVAPSWIRSLEEELALLTLSDRLDRPTELAAEAAKVQWASTGLNNRWSDYPEAIQVALLGLLVSRARHLQDTLQSEVGPRLALDRLSAYRDDRGLAKVEGLYPNRRPEQGTWADDARAWYRTLIEGLQNA